jgi:xanthine/CO dehydrogenase XdhC/CoxF family maturation factor
VMARTNDVLEAVESVANRGEVIAVVRILRDDPEKNATISVRNGRLVPPLDDLKLADRVLSSVESTTGKGAAADLIDAVDEEGSRVRLAIEIVRPKLELLIFGAGHVGQAVALIGALLGYDITVVDDREEFASRKRLPSPGINLLVSDYRNATDKLSLSPGTAVVIVTRGHQYDELCLKQVIGSEAGYIGMIGSRRRVLSVIKKLIGEGFRETDLQRLHAPIGLQIGARTPQEIAISILAEIIDQTNNPGRKHKGENNGI